MATPLDTLFDRYLEYLAEQGAYIISDRNFDTFRFVDYPAECWYERDLIADFVNWCCVQGYALKNPDAAGKLPAVASRYLKRVTGGKTFRPDLPMQRFIKGPSSGYSLNTYNVYEPLDWSPDQPPDLSFWPEMLLRLFHSDASLFEDWIAFKLQHPTAHLFGWLVESKHGTGKGVLFNSILAPLMGRGQYISPRNFPKGQFDYANYEGKLLASFQDVLGKRAADATAYESLKAMITDTTIEVEKKYEQARMSRLYCAVFISYNHDRAGGQPPIALPKGDRRFYTPARCEHLHCKAETDAFYECFFAELARCSPAGYFEEGMQTTWHDALYEHLINKEISKDFAPLNPPRNERFKEVVMSCQTGLLDLVDTLYSYSVVTHNFVRSLTGLVKDDALIRDALLEAGFVKYEKYQQVTIQGKRRRNIWYQPDRFGGKEPTQLEMEKKLNTPESALENFDDDCALNESYSRNIRRDDDGDSAEDSVPF